MTDRTRRLWLLLALLGSVLWSGGAILRQIHWSLRLQPGVVARVNDHLIDRDSIDRTVAGLDARVRHNEDAARQDVLARMIDEELLVQHALDSGAAQSSPEVRAALVRSAITRLNDEIAAESLSADELQRYFFAHRAAYATATRLALTTFYFESPMFPELQPAQARATGALELLRAKAPPAPAAITSDQPPFTLPEGPLSLQTLTNYLGPDAAASAGRLPTGACSEPLPFARGTLLVCVRERSGGSVPSLASIHELVMADALRERQEQGLQSLLLSLRRNAHIDVATPSPTTAAR
ncbi:MAG: peptidyl-prolyl cis-trans isomerase [Sinobacteraceae bacterium]|nr:peptidyl-prolyl cis-trans isomerase [Nevskiaceae bacterium]